MNDERESPEYGRCPNIGKVVKAVFGNGHPEDSLIVRTCNVEKQVSAIKRLSWATVCGVAAILLKILGSWIDAVFKSAG